MDKREKSFTKLYLRRFPSIEEKTIEVLIDNGYESEETLMVFDIESDLQLLPEVNMAQKSLLRFVLKELQSSVKFELKVSEDQNDSNILNDFNIKVNSIKTEPLVDNNINITDDEINSRHNMNYSNCSPYSLPQKVIKTQQYSDNEIIICNIRGNQSMDENIVTEDNNKIKLIPCFVRLTKLSYTESDDIQEYKPEIQLQFEPNIEPNFEKFDKSTDTRYQYLLNSRSNSITDSNSLINENINNSENIPRIVSLNTYTESESKPEFKPEIKCEPNVEKCDKSTDKYVLNSENNLKVETIAPQSDPLVDSQDMVNENRSIDQSSDSIIVIKQYKCSHNRCNKQFPNARGLRLHRLTHPSKKNRSINTRLSNRMSTRYVNESQIKDFRLRRRPTKEKIMANKLCNTKDKIVVNTKAKKLLNSIANEELKYMCLHNRCNKQFPNARSLRLHRSTHSSKTSKSLKPNLSNLMSANYENEPQFNEFGLRRSQIKEEIVGNKWCNTMNMIVINTNTKQPFNTTEQPFNTTEQPFNTTKQPLNTTKQPLNTTKQPLNSIVNEEPKYMCSSPGCEMWYKNSITLKAHELLHPELRPYSCDYERCGKSFKCPKNLSVHKRVHTGEKPYTCSFDNCGKRFAQLANIQAHERTHTKYKPYLCNYKECGKRFKQLSHLLFHKRRNHTREKPYICTIGNCTQSFFQLADLYRHFLKH